AVVALATMRGMVTMSLATPSVGELVGPGVAGAVLAHLEPDPSVTWDSARYDRIAAHLTP
ncbi:MAG: hypothetical protein HOV83_20910, partial [Catenulispora sp.]|nr:hypothetical protein [Catenulispora sp.]